MMWKLQLFLIINSVGFLYWANPTKAYGTGVPMPADFKGTNKAQDNLISPETLVNLRTVYGECLDGTRGCTGIPFGCIQDFLKDQESDNPPACTVMVSWEVQGDQNSYKITGTTQSDRGYVAMGFSNDTYMGADSVVGCYQLDAFGVTMNRFKNVPNGKSNQGLVDTPLLGLTPISTSVSDGHLFCEFQQVDHLIWGVIDVQLRQKEYYILLAKGSYGSPSSLSYHGNEMGVSSQKVDITFTGIIGDTSTSVTDEQQSSTDANFSSSDTRKPTFTYILLLSVLISLISFK